MFCLVELHVCLYELVTDTKPVFSIRNVISNGNFKKKPYKMLGCVREGHIASYYKMCYSKTMFSALRVCIDT